MGGPCVLVPDAMTKTSPHRLVPQLRESPAVAIADFLSEFAGAGCVAGFEAFSCFRLRRTMAGAATALSA